MSETLEFIPTNTGNEKPKKHKKATRIKTSEKEPVVFGEINTEDKPSEIKIDAEEKDMQEAMKDLARLGREKKEEKAKLGRILEAYEEADNVEKFMDFMLENSDLALTQERATSDAMIGQYLKANFKEQELGSRYEDFVQALPTEQDYMDKALGMKVEEAEKPQKTKIIEPKKQKPKNELIEAARKSAASEVPFLKPETREALKRVAKKEEEEYIKANQKFVATKEEIEGERSKNQDLLRAKQVGENRKEFLSKALIQAYREKGVKITKDNEADFLIKAPPFMYIFSAKGRKVRDLYARYVKELE